MLNKRKERQQRLTFTVLDLATEGEHLERGLELVARLLLERWQARHTRKESDVEEDS